VRDGVKRAHMLHSIVWMRKIHAELAMRKSPFALERVCTMRNLVDRWRFQHCAITRTEWTLIQVYYIVPFHAKYARRFQFRQSSGHLLNSMRFTTILNAVGSGFAVYVLSQPSGLALFSFDSDTVLLLGLDIKLSTHMFAWFGSQKQGFVVPIRSSI